MIVALSRPSLRMFGHRRKTVKWQPVSRQTFVQSWSSRGEKG